jgi:hypothetical protein
MKKFLSMDQYGFPISSVRQRADTQKCKVKMQPVKFAQTRQHQIKGIFTSYLFIFRKIADCRMYFSSLLMLITMFCPGGSGVDTLTGSKRPKKLQTSPESDIAK